MEIDACGMVLRVKEGKTVGVDGVIEPVLELRLGGFPNELEVEPVEPVLELGLGGFPNELDAPLSLCWSSGLEDSPPS